MAEITTTIKDETIVALGLENIQSEIDNKALEIDNRAALQIKQNLVEFLTANPSIMDSIKNKHNLDDSFKPIKDSPNNEPDLPG